MRKLKPEDRLVGAARGCEAQGILPVHLSLGIAAALYNVTKTKEEAIDLMKENAQITASEPLGRRVLAFYEDLQNNKNHFDRLISKIDCITVEERGSLA